MSGRFIAVVGPSGAGKDSVMEAMVADRPGLYRVRRVITRPSDAGGEAFEGVTEAEFAARVARGDFALHWSAHGLQYGIPAEVCAVLEVGKDALANLSRGVLKQASAAFGRLHVLSITAQPDVLASRLAGRGRESGAGIARRLARVAPAMPSGLTVTEIDNSGALDDAVAVALSALYPARG